MKLRRIMCGIVAAVTVCVSLSACGGLDSSSAADPADDTSSSAELAAPVFTENAAARVSVEGNKFVADGKELFMTGMNAPWDKWDDFGSGSFDILYWDEMFSTMKENGINSTRVWITCSGNVGIDIDDNGFVTGATEQHWQDLDTYFQLAEKYEIYVMATLISFDHFKDENDDHMKWRAMVQDDEAIDSYVQNYVIPFAKRYDGCEYLWSIDLCNEPDWVIENDECGKLSWESMGHYFARAAAAIHENSDILVTIGFGMVKYNSDKFNGDYGSDEFLKSCYDSEGAYLDFYSTHYYLWQQPYYGNPYTYSPEDFGLDTSKPIVLGECETTGLTGTTDLTLVECYRKLYENGWSGMLPWTTDGLKPFGEFINNVAPAAKEFSEYLAEQQ